MRINFRPHGRKIANSYTWVPSGRTENNTKCIIMQFENISIHCENTHIVEGCEITATVAPSAGWSCNAPNSSDPLLCSMYSIYLCLSMVDVVVFLVVWCVFSIIFCIKLVELCTFALTNIVWGNIYSIIYVNWIAFLRCSEMELLPTFPAVRCLELD